MMIAKAQTLKRNLSSPALAPPALRSRMHRNNPRRQPRYPGPSRQLENEGIGSRYMNTLTRICSAYGLQAWQCANASNFTGSEWSSIPRLDVRIETYDHAQLLQYYKEQIKGKTQERDGPSLHRQSKVRHSKKIKMYIVLGNSCEGNPIEVRVGLKSRGARISYHGPARDDRETMRVYICEGKRAEIVCSIREQVQQIKFGATASAYLIDKTRRFRVGALLVKSLRL